MELLPGARARAARERVGAEPVAEVLTKLVFGDCRFNDWSCWRSECEHQPATSVPLPGLANCLVCKTCSSLACSAIGISVISSRRIVPFSQSSSLPGFDCGSPVPFRSHPNSSVSSKSLGRAAQLTLGEPESGPDGQLVDQACRWSLCHFRFPRGSAPENRSRPAVLPAPAAFA